MSLSNSQQFNAVFLPPILLDQTQEDLEKAISDHCALTDLVRSMRRGDLNPEELLEAAEMFIDDMDGYADHVEKGLETVERQWQL